MRITSILSLSFGCVKFIFNYQCNQLLERLVSWITYCVSGETLKLCSVCHSLHKTNHLLRAIAYVISSVVTVNGNFSVALWLLQRYHGCTICERFIAVWQFAVSGNSRTTLLHLISICHCVRVLTCLVFVCVVWLKIPQRGFR